MEGQEKRDKVIPRPTKREEYKTKQKKVTKTDRDFFFILTVEFLLYLITLAKKEEKKNTFCCDVWTKSIKDVSEFKIPA